MISWLRTVFLKEFALISIAAGAGFVQTYWILSDSVPPWIYPFMAAVLTFSFYQIHKWVNYNWVKWRGLDENVAKPNLNLLIAGIVTTLFALVVFIIQYPITDLAVLSPAFLIGSAYVLPALWYQKRLRDRRLVKIFLISFTWAWVIGIWPAVIVHGNLSGFPLYLILLISIERALFIYALTVPFDIRDLWVDEHQGTITIPFAIGMKNAKRTAYMAAIGHGAIMGILLFLLDKQLIPVLPGVYILLIVILKLIRNAKPDSPDYYYSFYIDGCIIAQALMIIFLLN